MRVGKIRGGPRKKREREQSFFPCAYICENMHCKPLPFTATVGPEKKWLWGRPSLGHHGTHSLMV